MADSGWRLGFVTPRYGPGVVGGSEAVIAEAAKGLAGRGHDVTILTTCAKSHVSWANEFDRGRFEEDGVTIERFAASRRGARVAAADLERRVQRSESLSAAEEIAWVNGRFQVPDLYLRLVSGASRFDAIVFSPYLFWTTVYGVSVAPDRSIVMPCLHDEPYAWLSIVRSTLEDAGGAWFLSEPEHQLAHRVAPGLAAHHAVVGAAVEVPASYDPLGFVERHGLSRPFVLYAGRREEGKGWRRLLGSFATALVGGDVALDLVTVGVGNPEIPAGLADRVIDLGYLDAADLSDGIAAAEALVQPSTNESFSRTLMEAWLAGTPVIAASAGQVVAWHCERSGGGLVYSDDYEFAHCLRVLAESPKIAAQLAERGRHYVNTYYRWPVVLDQMEESLDRFTRGRKR